MCQKHWNRYVRHGDPTVALKPWAKTAKSPYCSWGHDKRVVGVTKQGACKECNRRHARLQHKRRGRRERPIPNLAAMRKRHGLSQDALAKRAGLHRNCILAVEKGRPARPSTQEKLIRAFARLRKEERRKRERERYRIEIEIQKRLRGW